MKSKAFILADTLVIVVLVIMIILIFGATIDRQRAYEERLSDYISEGEAIAQKYRRLNREN